VVFNVPFTTYSETVAYRTQGAVEVAKLGGIASVVRSVTPYSLYTPHTGNMAYQDGVPKIPTFAITLEDAALMGRLQSYGEPIQLNSFSILITKTLSVKIFWRRFLERKIQNLFQRSEVISIPGMLVLVRLMMAVVISQPGKLFEF